MEHFVQCLVGAHILLHECPHDRIESELVNENFEEVGRNIQKNVVFAWILLFFPLTFFDEVEENEVSCRVDHNRQRFPLVAPDRFEQ